MREMEGACMRRGAQPGRSVRVSSQLRRCWWRARRQAAAAPQTRPGTVRPWRAGLCGAGHSGGGGLVAAARQGPPVAAGRHLARRRVAEPAVQARRRHHGVDGVPPCYPAAQRAILLPTVLSRRRAVALLACQDMLMPCPGHGLGQPATHADCLSPRARSDAYLPPGAALFVYRPGADRSGAACATAACQRYADLATRVLTTVPIDGAQNLRKVASKRRVCC